MYPFFIPPMMPMGFMPMAQAPQGFGSLSPEVGQQEFNKALLSQQKQMMARTLEALEEYQKQLKEGMAAIDQQLAKLADAETERKKGSAGQRKS
jgi:hypothetical protein